jgi:hypothetical protein
MRSVCGWVLAGESNRPRTQSSYQEKMHKVCSLRRSITKQRDAENPLKREKILEQDSCRYICAIRAWQQGWTWATLVIGGSFYLSAAMDLMGRRNSDGSTNELYKSFMILSLFFLFDSTISSFGHFFCFLFCFSNNTSPPPYTLERCQGDCPSPYNQGGRYIVGERR